MAKTNKGRDYSQLLIWAAMLVTVARYAGAFVASDMGALSGWVSDAITVSMGITGLGMGILDVIGGAYIFDGWRRVMPRSGGRWPFKFKILTGFVFGLFGVGVFILVPFTVSRVLHQPIGELLPLGWLWVWAIAVNLAPYLLIGGVVMGQTGVVAVSGPGQAGQALSQLESEPDSDRTVTGRNGQDAASWPDLTDAQRKAVGQLSASQIASKFHVSERTARRWKERAG